MKNNKLVLAMVASSLLSSMSVMADNKATFDIEYQKLSEIVIDTYENDVDLTNDGAFDGSGNMLGKIDFCVGRTNAAAGTSLGYNLTASTPSRGNLSNGTDSYPYELHYAASPDTAFDPSSIALTLDQEVSGSTELSECTGTTNAAMWVKVAAGDISAMTTGTYADIVTLTVAPSS